MADNQNLPNTDQLPELLSTLMANKELMDKISGIMGTAPQEKQEEQAPTAPVELGSLLSDPTVMAKLPEVISVLRPMFGDGGQKAPPKNESPHASNRRMTLLCALKPYLSPRRCEAIDYITRISKLGDMMKNMKL